MLKAKEYVAFQPFILKMIFNYFHDPQYYNAKSQPFIRKTIIENAWKRTPKAVLLFTFFTENENRYPGEITLFLKEHAKSCNSFNRKNILPYISLIMLAKFQNQGAIDKLLKILKNINNSDQRIKDATYMFPYLTLVHDTKIVEQLTQFLSDEKIVDQGEDILHRYTGISALAASALYTMIEGFPTFSRYEFNDNERKKCLDWMRKNPNYKFKKFDYWNDDPVIKRMRYMIFEYN
ncbi:MAG: hypothetical protein LBM70_03650 [Victivallales bacterium]|jgi:hypothetical protein|nr:hypothetical protein [Victivallales bacterium]